MRRSIRVSVISLFAVGAMSLLVWATVIASGSGVASSSSGWTDTVSWTVDRDEATGISTISWTDGDAGNPKEGEGEVRGNSSDDQQIGGEGNGNIGFRIKTPGKTWGTVGDDDVEMFQGQLNPTGPGGI